MKSLKIQLALAGLAAVAASAATYTTSFDTPTFSSGGLDGQDGWVTQAQWEADGAGNATNTNNTHATSTNVGAFIRAHNTGVLGTTDIGEEMSITSSIILGAFSSPSTDIASFEEGIFQQGMSHQQGNAGFSYGIATGLFYQVSSGNLLLRQNQGLNEVGVSSLSLGAASGFGGSSLTLTTVYTKTAADTWSVVASVSGAATGSISYTANGQDANLDADTGGGGIIGGVQALPSGGGSPGVATPPFGTTTLTDYTITVTPVPEPSSLFLLGLSGFALLLRRR
ncbi:MAG: PEP-CTERM sorting domain-containing protein [Roseibacillus sp.]